MTSLKIFLFATSTLLVSCNQPASDDTQSATKTPTQVEDGAKYQDNLPTSYALGNHAAKEVIAGWDIEIRPDGLGLPPGAGSVEDGEELYEDKCAMCHGSFGEGVGQWPKLSGGEDTLTDDRPEKTVGSYWPYASTLWDYINRAMPFTEPQSLEADEVYAITAYVLYLNEIVEDDFELTKENFATIEMPNKDGFYLDNRPDTNNTRCMENCKDPSSINVVLGPEYSLGGKAEESTKEATVVEHPGKNTYMNACNLCHATGLSNAPKLNAAEDWTERLTQDKNAIYNNALNGLNAMPAKGGRVDLSDQAVKDAVDYMLSSLE